MKCLHFAKKIRKKLDCLGLLEKIKLKKEGNMKLKKLIKIFMILMLIAASLYISSECILRMNIYEYIFAHVSAHQAFHKAVRLCEKNQEEIMGISAEFLTKAEPGMSSKEIANLCKWFEDKPERAWLGRITSMDYPDYERRLKDRLTYCYKDFRYRDNYEIRVCNVEILYIDTKEMAKEIIEEEYFSGRSVYHNLKKINDNLYVIITQWTTE